jgi:phenylalanyl-tRNA synthetase alpha chain
MSDQRGHLHPLTQIQRDIVAIFTNLGFDVTHGPEVENEYYNFEALNIPDEHPSRDMQDTFWLKPLAERQLLRTHTSPNQIRYMQEHEPPLRVIVPGKVYRNEATDATHEAQFHQVEGLMVGREVSLATLKGTLETLFSQFFDTDIATRFRPSYFPFVEPGVEVDISCFCCGGDGCRLCKHSGWIELLGAGMVHPTVLEHGGVDPDEWQGFAFGIGLDRLAMVSYGIDDIRHLYSGDLRVVNQF